MSVLTQGRYEIIQHFQGHRHFARDHQLRLATPGWRVLDFDVNLLLEDELERRQEKIMLAPPYSPGPRISFSGGADSGCVRKCGSTFANTGESFVPRECSSNGWELQDRRKPVGVIRADSQSDQCNCCFVSR